MGNIKKRKYVGTNEVLADVVRAIESDGRWNNIEAGKRLGAKQAAVEAALQVYDSFLDQVEATAVSAVSEQVEMKGAATVQLPLEGMPEVFRAVVVVNEDGSKEILSTQHATPNQHAEFTGLRMEKKKFQFKMALKRHEDSERIVALVGPEQADKPFGEIFPADVFPQVNTAAPLKEIGDGE